MICCAVNWVQHKWRELCNLNDFLSNAHVVTCVVIALAGIRITLPLTSETTTFLCVACSFTLTCCIYFTANSLMNEWIPMNLFAQCPKHVQYLSQWLLHGHLCKTHRSPLHWQGASLQYTATNFFCFLSGGSSSERNLIGCGFESLMKAATCTHSIILQLS